MGGVQLSLCNYSYCWKAGRCCLLSYTPALQDVGRKGGHPKSAPVFLPINVAMMKTFGSLFGKNSAAVGQWDHMPIL